MIAHCGRLLQATVIVALTGCSKVAPGHRGMVAGGESAQHEICSADPLQTKTNHGSGQGYGVGSNIKPGEITGVDLEHLFTLMQDQRVLLVDCRPGIYYHMGHIKDAINLPLKRYAKSVTATRKYFDEARSSGRVIVLYCQNFNCPDAYLFAKKIAREGYPISIYKGGWEEWKASGL
jgi:rhodanese-related sulfurtransferase